MNRSPGRGSGGHDDAVEHAQTGLAAYAQELNRRERDLMAREQRAPEDGVRPRATCGSRGRDPEERLAHIEERIAALHEAEKAFARTQAELAARSAELATREAALAENARLGVVDAGPAIPSRAEMDELDERLRRLERETREATKEHGFGDSLRALENTRPPRQLAERVRTSLHLTSLAGR